MRLVANISEGIDKTYRGNADTKKERKRLRTLYNYYIYKHTTQFYKLQSLIRNESKKVK